MMGKIMISKFQKLAYLFDPLDKSRVQCNTCWHHCQITPGKMGICKTRKNVNGEFITLNYGLCSSLSINPIEKKPLFHYFPGSRALTIGSVSCNFNCPWCQNWTISKIHPGKVKHKRYLSPKDLVEMASNNIQIQGISFSFNEPVIWLEYILDVFELCDDSLYQMIVTNGYMTPEALNLLIDSGMTGMSVTVKGNTETVKNFCGANVKNVWQNIERAYKKDVHIEIICLVIPRINDSTNYFHQVGERIVTLDPNIPLHFTRFFPDYKFNNVDPPPITTLEEAHAIACQQGLNYVYLGNLFGHPLENTYCPECKEVLIQRTGYEIKQFLTSTNKCPSCRKGIPIRQFENKIF